MAEGYSNNKLMRRDEVLEIRIKVCEENHEKEIAHKNSIIEDADMKIESLEIENEDLKTKVQEEKDRRKTLESTIDKKDQQVNALEAKVKVLKKEREDLSIKLEQLEENDAQKSEEIKQLKKRVKQMNNQIEEIEKSIEKKIERSMEKCMEKCLEKSMEKCMEKCMLGKLEHVIQKEFSKCINGDDTTKSNTCNFKEAKNCKISNETFNITVKSANNRSVLIPNKPDYNIPDQKSNRRNKNRPN